MKAIDENFLMAKQSTTIIPVVSAREEAPRRQSVLRQRAFRNIVKIRYCAMRQQQIQWTFTWTPTTMLLRSREPFESWVIFRAGFPRKARLLKNALSFKDVANMEAEFRAFKGDAKPTRFEPHVVTQEGEKISCICGGPEADDDYDDK